MASVAIRYVFIVLAAIISLHFILSFSNESYGQATSLDSLKSHVYNGASEDAIPAGDTMPEAYADAALEKTKTTTSASVSTTPVDTGKRANAAFVILARNSDLKGIIPSIKQMEDRFNKKYQYPYIFLNEEKFDDKFKERVSELTDAKVEYGLIPKDHWVQPSWINETRAAASREAMVQDKVIYGGSVPYRNMCRFNSGFFYRHELLKPYKYYWRIEPDVSFFCDLDYDPFMFMQENKKVYGFTISLYEYEKTIPTLWKEVKNFINANPKLVPAENAMDFLSDDGGETYNRCHFWSNFEIGDLDLWRGEAYSKFFDYLDEQGGFYYERWGDAPVHSIGAALFARKDQIHFFDDIGYRHNPFQHCPQKALHKKGKCWCDPDENFDREWYSCLNRYEKLFDPNA